MNCSLLKGSDYKTKCTVEVPYYSTAERHPADQNHSLVQELMLLWSSHSEVHTC